MRQWIGIALLCVFSVFGTEMHQLLKLPVLFQHYAEHQANDPMDWWEFLEEHYTHDRHHHNGEDHHHDLPFHCDHHCGAQTLVARINDQSVSAIGLADGPNVALIATEDRIPPSEGPDGVWQPPKA